MNATDTAPDSERQEERVTPRQRVAYWVYASVAWVAQRLPTDLGRWLFRSAGALAFRFGPAHTRGVVLENQARVIGRPPDDPLVRASAREAYRRYARYWFDAFNVLGWPDERVMARERIVLGGGSRDRKVVGPPALLTALPGAEVVSELAKVSES